MSQQELDLLQFAACGMAQARAGPPQVVACKQSATRPTPLHDTTSARLEPNLAFRSEISDSATLYDTRGAGL